MSNLRPRKNKMESSKDTKDLVAHVSLRQTSSRKNQRRKLLLRASKPVVLASHVKSALRVLRLTPSLPRKESKRVNVLNLQLVQKVTSET